MSLSRWPWKLEMHLRRSFALDGFYARSRALLLLLTLFCSMAVGVRSRLGCFCGAALGAMQASELRAAGLGSSFFLASLFRSTAVSPCPGRDFISFSNGEKETEAKKTPTDASFEVSNSCGLQHVGPHAGLRKWKVARSAETRPLRPTARTRFARTAQVDIVRSVGIMALWLRSTRLRCAQPKPNRRFSCTKLRI